ncbi:MAG TPA: hypothetical protein VHE80_09010, partial [Acidimicrobiales bacterium]|nr:hypothetical protein [Acidimicrobiales bacterium]
VEGYTNFLWTLWMAVVHVARVPESLTSLAVMASGAALLAVTTVLTGAVARRLAPDRPAAAVVAMWLTALSYPLVFWSLRGMEVALVAATTTGAVLLSLRLRDAPTRPNALALGAVVAAAVLTRDDALVTAVVVCAFAAVTAEPSRRKEVGATLGAVLLGAVAAHTAFRLAYYGDVVPNTYHLKLGGIGLGTRVERGLTTLLVTAVSHVGAAVVVAGAGVASLRRRAHPGVVLVAAVVVAQAAYSVYVGGDAWEWMQHANRYLAPVLPGLFVLAGLGVSALLEKRDEGRPGWLLGVGAASLALAGVAWLVGTPAPLEYLAPRESQSALVPVVLLAVVGGSLAAVAVAGQRAPRALTVGGLTLVLLAALNGGPMARWATDNAVLVGGDEAWTRYGVALRRATRPGATVAVAAAGAISYFSDRRSVDMLGKSDREIARGRPHSGPLLTGHVKSPWNGRLRSASCVGHPPSADGATYGRSRPWQFLLVPTTSSSAWMSTRTRSPLGSCALAARSPM